jgi:hypothetical protein
VIGFIDVNGLNIISFDGIIIFLNVVNELSMEGTEGDVNP